METLETVTEIASQVLPLVRLYQFICILHCGRLSFGWDSVPSGTWYPRNDKNI